MPRSAIPKSNRLTIWACGRESMNGSHRRTIKSRRLTPFDGGPPCSTITSAMFLPFSRPLAEQEPVEFLEPVDVAIERQGLAPVAIIGCPADPSRRIAIAQPPDLGRQVVNVAAAEQQSRHVVLQRLGARGVVADDRRNPIREGLVDAEAESLVPERRKHQGSCAPEMGPDLRVVDPAGNRRT